jgi:nicotinic acid mononucleotide adenylyltransferase
VIVDREGAPEAPTPPGWTTTHVSMPPVDVSSTGVRERAAAGESIVDLVPATVVDLIRDRRLYGLSAS